MWHESFTIFKPENFYRRNPPRSMTCLWKYKFYVFKNVFDMLPGGGTPSHSPSRIGSQHIFVLVLLSPETPLCSERSCGCSRLGCPGGPPAHANLPITASKDSNPVELFAKNLGVPAGIVRGAVLGWLVSVYACETHQGQPSADN